MNVTLYLFSCILCSLIILALNLDFILNHFSLFHKVNTLLVLPVGSRNWRETDPVVHGGKKSENSHFATEECPVVVSAHLLGLSLPSIPPS
ncbi:hypothetical protein AMECASPLE_028622 [Ameca splendens]|uniref:Secreted protein n=1 Tax=Ameca splendens TaxID=208324 RepID=A0ABV0XIL4_9TELE